MTAFAHANTQSELIRTERGFVATERVNDLGRVVYEVRNQDGGLLATRRFADDAIVYAQELDSMLDARRQ